MKTSLKAVVLASTAFAGLVSGQGASAQVARAADAQSEPEAEFAEIIVTANRRAERLQDAPIAINAIGGAALTSSGISGTSTLQVAVPTLVMQRQANALTPFLRGIGFSSGDINSESSVAIYQDGVYLPTAAGNFFEFSDVERVEVLKGPQGTLFGRNSTGGVIQVITKAPSFTATGDFSLTYANYDKVIASGYVSGPLGADVAASISVRYSDQGDGWGTNLTYGTPNFKNHDFGLRGKLLFTPGDRTKVTLAGDYMESFNAGITGQPIPGAATVLGQPYPGRFNTYSDTVDSSDTKGYGGSATIEHEFNDVQFKSISAYRKFEGQWIIDQDLSPVPLVAAFMDQRTEMFSQEVHLFAKPDAKFQWLVGAYYFDYKAGQLPLVIKGLVFSPPGLVPPDPNSGLDQFAETHVKSYSVFAQGTYPIAEETNLTVGGRYTWDRSLFTGSVYLTGTSIFAGPTNSPFPIVMSPQSPPKLKYEKPTWRIALDHKFAPDILGYISYNRGVKSGNYSSSNTVLQTPYNPEQLDAFEVGMKNQFLGRRLTVNIAAFHYNFKNIQFQRIVQGAPDIFNGPSAKIYGGELEISYRASDRLAINGNIAYLHSKIGDFPNAPNVNRLPNGTNDFGTLGYNAQGNDLPNSPPFSGNIGFTYALPVSSGKIDFAGNAYYTDSHFAEPDNRLVKRSYALLNGSITYRGDSGFSVGIWGKNLADEYYYQQLTAQAGIIDLGGPAEPRTYGVTVGYAF